ncbi:DsbA family oxidoreductase [Paenibacillus sp. CGMCC 1.16610]|uniref:DsbA family oxidoreductase n=1 Tax=Paenibacillus anseongense TaxID=2682845 RepID=A0ABW9UJK4_9BACL|nr:MULTISPECIES: DsbA family oxidoreductase [Paenibacillus]MBA2939834.1 DsbA family oxidoreductase [Paenibacillus sp. CGMCC 1.16610]MVQ39494.1 DsbA family oxidoreductase [Paenibacillus anseongense]
MKIEVWSDVMCPMCYIGKTNLDKALQEFGQKEQVEIVYRPFQLFPDAPSHTGKNYYDWTAMIHGGGMSSEYVRESNKSVVEMGKNIGLTYNLDTLIPANTTDALRVAIYAQEQGKAAEWMATIYKAYFTDALDISDHETLAKLAGESGLETSVVLGMLSSDRYKDTVKKERQTGSRMGISGTPFYIFNDKYAVSGVRSSHAFLEIIEQVWREEHPLQMIDNGINGSSEGGICGVDGSCKI